MFTARLIKLGFFTYKCIGILTTSIHIIQWVAATPTLARDDVKLDMILECFLFMHQHVGQVRCSYLAQREEPANQRPSWNDVRPQHFIGGMNDAADKSN